MDKSWIKLFRKIGDHEIINDEKGLRLFIWLLVTVDKKTGSRKIGTIWLADRMSWSRGTLRHVIERLRDRYQIVATSATNKSTTIRVLNWAKYQQSEELRPSPRPSKGHQKATLQEYKNILSTNVDNGVPPNGVDKKKFGNPEVSRILEEFSTLTGLSKPSDREPRRWAWLFASNKTMGVEHFGPCLQYLQSVWTRADILKVETVYRNFQLYERDVLKRSGREMSEEERRRAELYASRK